MAAPRYRRASEYAKGIGETLDKIAGQDVLLVGYTISERSMRGEDKTFVGLTLALDISKPEVTGAYHAWSDSLAEKLRDIPENELPVVIAFERTATAGGFRVWTIT